MALKIVSDNLDTELHSTKSIDAKTMNTTNIDGSSIDLENITIQHSIQHPQIPLQQKPDQTIQQTHSPTYAPKVLAVNISNASANNLSPNKSSANTASANKESVHISSANKESVHISSGYKMSIDNSAFNRTASINKNMASNSVSNSIANSMPSTSKHFGLNSSCSTNPSYSSNPSLQLKPKFTHPTLNQTSHSTPQHKFVCSKNMQGRPRKEHSSCNQYEKAGENMITSQMQSKRADFGCNTNTQQLTGLFLLWSRKQITQQQFIAGVYYEDLQRKLKRSMGSLAGGTASSLARVHQAHIGEMNNKLQSINISETALRIENGINNVLEYVHINALNIVKRVLNPDCLTSAECVKSLSYTDLGIFKKSLDVINKYIADNSISVQEYIKIA